ncbi:MAG: AAA domain-containing protein [Veillonella caviae]|uniref:AAA domain-containing protein n=1 Tax=Veillonella caviae TaxID=248316 RepID=UPI002A916404|nr:AAA domain-containing protein [Veillonella caviae]MDY5482568.1 AAA domain-containing protein [Veillonella caviae]
MRDTAKQIINYWYSLECLQPKEVPKYKAIPKKYVKELIFATENDRTTIYQQSVIKPYWRNTNSRVSTYVVPLPNDHYNYAIIDEIKYFKDEKVYVLDDEHAVLLSVVKGTEVLEAFIDKLEIEYPEKPYLGNVYSASFVVDAEGYYKEGSLQIAPFIWVIYQMMSQPDVEFKDIKLDGWHEIVKSIEDSFNLPEEKVSLDNAARVINTYLREHILEPMGITMFRAGDIYGYCGFQAEEIQLVKAETMPINDLKSSFFLDDLQLVLQHIDTLKDKDKVLSYINSLNQDIEHYDLLKDTDQMRKWYNPKVLPYGRWPSKFNLSFMQQIAVNIAKENPKDIFSVNGPPGTGKTTLLKDIIASNIVERAAKFCESNHVNDIFKKVIGRAGTSFYYDIPSDIAIYGMLVLSSNNKAVENITLELPNISSVEEGSNGSTLFNPDSSEQQVDLSCFAEDKKYQFVKSNEVYFTFLADRLAESNEQWGLISARLGKKSNINTFMPVLDVLSSDMSSIMGVPSVQDAFESAKKQFQAQYNLVKTLFDYVTVYEDNIKLIQELNLKTNQLQEDVLSINEQLSKYDTLDDDLLKLLEHKNSIETKLIEYNNQRSIFDKLWNATNWSILKAMSNPALLSVIEENTIKFQNIKRELDVLHRLVNERDSIVKMKDSLLADIKALDGTVKEAEKTQQEILGTLKSSGKDTIHCFDDIASKVISSDMDRAEAHTAFLYVCNYLNECRERLLYDALQLQKTVVMSDAFRKNMELLSQYWGSLSDRKKLQKNFDLNIIFPALINSLMIAVPVISSTFAAVERFLINCKAKNSLGTIIIDEAGQASPHMLVGALFRAQKAIVVGDPKQIEPVQTVQDLFVEKIGGEGIGKYRSKALSVQSLADAQNPFAGIIKSLDGSESWVGCPLVIHRRCKNPMFTVANELSYGGFMINKTINSKEPIEPCRESCWITYDASNIESTTGKDRYIQVQGQIAFELIQKLRARNTKFKDIFIITPFTSVAYGFKKYIKSISDDTVNWTKEDNKKDWLNDNIGTVHTFQGKEAKVVIYMLGCQSDGSANGAIKWVNANNVNVALTRAKEYVYVIGDATKWAELNKNLAFSQRYLPIYILEDI